IVGFGGIPATCGAKRSSLKTYIHVALPICLLGFLPERIPSLEVFKQRGLLPRNTITHWIITLSCRVTQGDKNLSVVVTMHAIGTEPYSVFQKPIPNPNSKSPVAIGKCTRAVDTDSVVLTQGTRQLSSSAAVSMTEQPFRPVGSPPSSSDFVPLSCSSSLMGHSSMLIFINGPLSSVLSSLNGSLSPILVFLGYLPFKKHMPPGGSHPIYEIETSLVKLMLVASRTLSNHLVLCRPLVLGHSILPNIRVFPGRASSTSAEAAFRAANNSKSP
ncbi:Hypothetical predicted protein, partial [Podarcis lilfordi]